MRNPCNSRGQSWCSGAPPCLCEYNQRRPRTARGRATDILHPRSVRTYVMQTVDVDNVLHRSTIDTHCGQRSCERPSHAPSCHGRCRHTRRGAPARSFWPMRPPKRQPALQALRKQDPRAASRESSNWTPCGFQCTDTVSHGH
jgi:hypothetical protein